MIISFDSLLPFGRGNNPDISTYIFTYFLSNHYRILHRESECIRQSLEDHNAKRHLPGSFKVYPLPPAERNDDTNVSNYPNSRPSSPSLLLLSPLCESGAELIVGVSCPQLLEWTYFFSCLQCIVCVIL